MSTSPNWGPEHSPADPSSVELPSMANSSDLFHGELFGDELLDIYNAAVEVNANSDSHQDNEIPILPGDEHTKGDAPNPIHSEDHNNAGTNVTDDGFGAFRSSTSFNDLATLLPPDGTSKGAPGQPDAHPGAPHAQAPDSSIVVSDAPVNATLKEDSTHPVPVAPTPAVSALLSQPTASAPKRKASTTLAPKNVKKQAAGVVTAAPLAKSGIQVPGTFVAAMEAKLVAQKPAAGTTPRANPAPAAGKTNATDKKILSSVAPDNASSTPSKSVTEADFKGVAQAAVSSLILSTKNGELPPGDGSGDGEKVDTSTAHIKALTGTNWVTACSGVGAAAVAINSGDPKSNNNRSKRQNLTADERARQNRDRNREHARNTRLRKKAYVEELKRTLTELVAQRDKADLEKRQVAQREVEQREVRFRVIEEYLKLRSRNESNYASWAAILDANFKLTLPATEFLEDGESAGVPDPTAGVKLEKTFTGVPAVMAESNKFASFLQTLGSASKISECNSVGFVYTGDRSDFFMDDNQAVLEWTANTVGLTMRGATAELTIRGSIRASFCPASNKLLSANMMYDTGAVISQLQEYLSSDTDATRAAAAAASHADAILDSLQMPQMNKHVGTVAVVPQSSSSVSEHEHSDDGSK